MFHAVSMTLSTCCGSASVRTTMNGAIPSCTMRASSSSAGWVRPSFMSGKSSTPKHGWPMPVTPAARESSFIRRICTLETLRSPAGTPSSLASGAEPRLSSAPDEILLRKTPLLEPSRWAARILVVLVSARLLLLPPLAEVKRAVRRWVGLAVPDDVERLFRHVRWMDLALPSSKEEVKRGMAFADDY